MFLKPGQWNRSVLLLFFFLNVSAFGEADLQQLKKKKKSFTSPSLSPTHIAGCAIDRPAGLVSLCKYFAKSWEQGQSLRRKY